jgi:hypothetical protein
LIKRSGLKEECLLLNLNPFNPERRSYENTPKWHDFLLDQTGRSQPEAGLNPEPGNDQF